MSTRSAVEFAAFVAKNGPGPMRVMQSQWRTDRTLIEMAKIVMMKSGGRAEEYINHYMDGTGTPKYFMASQLLNEDSGVSRGFINAINNEAKKSRMKPGQKGRYWVKQEYYTNKDWWMALGSFPLDWVYMGERQSNGTTMLELTISGKNEYKWHPDEDRETKLVHQAADRLRHPQTNVLDILQPTQPAANFWMYATPCTYLVPYSGAYAY